MRKYTYSDGLRNGSRNPRLYLVREGEATKFDGQTIPNVCLVVSKCYEKNGKWSNTTYQLSAPDDVAVVFMLSPLHGRYGDDFTGWQNASEKMGVSITVAKQLLSIEYPTTAARLNEIENFSA